MLPVSSVLLRRILAPLILLVCTVLFLQHPLHRPGIFQTSSVHGANATVPGIDLIANLSNFWQDLAAALVDAQPQCPPLKLDGRPIGSVAEFRPIERGHEMPPDRLVDFSETDETALLQAHYRMRTSAQRLASALPFTENTTGIVTTADARYIPIFLVSLRMLRRTGCELPVEVFIDDWSKYDPTICDIILPSLNARCIIVSDIYNRAPTLEKPDHFQYKILAILFSSFQHTLFLDSDAFPTSDPTALFSTAPYTTHNLITWPDYWALTISPHFYHIAAIPPSLPHSRYSTESGQLLLNKHVHWESLLMMTYYNYYGPGYYYILLSQGSHGAGDKETFVQAALAVGLPYYQVRTGPAALGRVRNGAFEGVGMAQADPRSDAAYLPPARSHVHTEELWQGGDVGGEGMDGVPPRPRPLFLHHNALKLDPKSVLENKEANMFDGDGTPHRMWGSEREMVGMLGYDVERVLWDVIAEEACREDAGGRNCVDVRHHVRRIFG